jgi:hypothetical protein
VKVFTLQGMSNDLTMNTIGKLICEDILAHVSRYFLHPQQAFIREWTLKRLFDCLVKYLMLKKIEEVNLASILDNKQAPIYNETNFKFIVCLTFLVFIDAEKYGLEKEFTDAFAKAMDILYDEFDFKDLKKIKLNDVAI